MSASSADAGARPDAAVALDAADVGRADARALDDGGAPQDAAPELDAGDRADVGGPGAEGGVPGDAGPTAGTAVTLTYRAATGTFDRAFVGYVSDSVGGAPRGLYFELSRGADDACPSETSPVPQQILTLDGFATAAPGAQSDGLDVRFFDFEGLFRAEIAPDMATAARVEITAIDLAGGTAEGAVSLTFPDGVAMGSFRATHCASLDSPLP